MVRAIQPSVVLSSLMHLRAGRGDFGSTTLLSPVSAGLSSAMGMMMGFMGGCSFLGLRVENENAHIPKREAGGDVRFKYLKEKYLWLRMTSSLVPALGAVGSITLLPS